MHQGAAVSWVIAPVLAFAPQAQPAVAASAVGVLDSAVEPVGSAAGPVRFVAEKQQETEQPTVVHPLMWLEHRLTCRDSSAS
uniref:Secreted protein n=1 Tax=Haemonchus contortus TaxID=6289 RepID=W6NCC6_HAECO